MERGARNIKNAKGLTPHDLLLEHLTEAKNGDNLLHQAVRKGDSGLLEIMLKMCIYLPIAWSYETTLNSYNEEGDTPLHIAAASSDLSKILHLLISSGAKVNIKGKKPAYSLIPNSVRRAGDTPLHVAARLGNLNSIHTLIGRGARNTLGNCDGDLPIHLAARFGKVEAIKILVKKAESTVNAENSRMSDTPLGLAALSGHADCMAELIDAGACPDHVNGRGVSVLAAALTGGEGNAYGFGYPAGHAERARCAALLFGAFRDEAKAAEGADLPELLKEKVMEELNELSAEKGRKERVEKVMGRLLKIKERRGTSPSLIRVHVNKVNGDV